MVQTRDVTIVNSACPSGEQAYTLTPEDVESFVATRGDDDPVGAPCHAGKCLLAQAFEWKYPGLVRPEYYLIVDPDRIYVEGTTIEIPLGEDVQHYMNIFDDISCGFFGATVSKREWLEAKAQYEEAEA